MTSLPTRRSRYTAATIALLTVTLVPGLQQLPALADDSGPAPVAPLKPATGKVPDLSTTYRTLGDPVAGHPDVDLRGRALPSLAQQDAAARLGRDVTLRWNSFGTPASILPLDGVLAKATSSDPVVAARSWLSTHADLFGLTRAQVADLLAEDQLLADGGGHAVFFRQRFGDLLPALGSAVTVGVAHGEIAYVSSSITKTTQQAPAATLTPLQGWLKAAQDVDLKLPADLETLVTKVSDGWTRIKVPGIPQEQLVRLRALAKADGSVRPVLEANVLNVAGGEVAGYTVLVDAVDGVVLHRQNKVLNHSDLATSPATVVGMPQVLTAPRSEGTTPFTGEITASDCGPRHEFKVTDTKTKTITVVGAAVNTANDIAINLYDPAGRVVASADTATSPEVITYAPDTAIPAGTWKAEVCPFDSPTAPLLPPFNYALTVNTSDTGAPSASPGRYNPKWRYFTANPTLDSPTQTPKNSVVGCWIRVSGCTVKTGGFNNIQAFVPWDVNTNTGLSTNTTAGNNALTREAWVSPLTPGGLAQAPVSATGDYRLPFTDAWNNSKCNPAELVPGGNDINFSVANLFVVHNRMHDYSYYLGFTEENYNLQLDNGGRGGLENDAEVGNVQAGALGGLQTGMGRDNANQIALQDGVPGITNQYLFQPIAGAFYSPCTDGGLDMGIVGHEYTHAISNRMVGGPDEGLTSEQGGAMGESWSDQVAAEFQFSHGYSNGGNVWAVGAYATGNKTVAIRDYSIDHNPLNYSNYGFDSTGPEVHADGEIWNGTNWEVRSALVKKYNKRYPYRDKALQLRCAQATATRTPLPATQCPGNRRWIQMMFDSFLLQQGATTMLDARDAMIASDRMRFRGANKTIMWDAFARRGMGVGAKARDGEDTKPTPSFQTIGGTRRNAQVTFKVAKESSIYVGDFQARSRAIADTRTRTKVKQSASFAPGRYDMLVTNPRTGFMRFHLVVKPGAKTLVKRVSTSTNYAAKASGAKIVRSTAGGRNPNALIDGGEVFGWGAVTEASVDSSKPSIVVDLAGRTPRTIRTVAVSAALRPAYGDDADSGSRFTALRRFAVDACVTACSTSKAKWKRVYVSKSNAFPAARPRPVAPTLNMRAFEIPATRATALRLVVLENQCTGFSGFAGELDADPANTTDCKAGSDRDTIAHVTEFQAFSTRFPSWRSSYGIDNAQRSYRR